MEGVSQTQVRNTGSGRTMHMSDRITVIKTGRKFENAEIPAIPTLLPARASPLTSRDSIAAILASSLAISLFRSAFTVNKEAENHACRHEVPEG